jgi:hypothetical protein
MTAHVSESFDTPRGTFWPGLDGTARFSIAVVVFNLAVFRDAIDRSSAWIDDATWRRARGWALALGVAWLAHSLDNPTMNRIGRRTVAAVLADPGA